MPLYREKSYCKQELDQGVGGRVLKVLVGVMDLSWRTSPTKTNTDHVEMASQGNPAPGL